ncbi:MAG: hypothetical protein IPK32_02515 [Verrucomicrobiaceae bacterium]|nr:hypothetical protein [Verrucomicrobiaceae bacterium]
MNRSLCVFLLASAGFASLDSVFAQMPPPPPGYGTMGVAPPPMLPPPTVPAYPNAMPPPSISPGVTPPPPMIDPYSAPPPPGNMAPLPPQSTAPYGAPPPMDPNYTGAPMGGPVAGPSGGPGIINYDYAELTYRFIDPKAPGLKGASTIGATLSVALFEPLYIKIGANWGSGADSGPGGSNYDFASIQAGVGFHTQLVSPKLQFVGEAGVSYASLKASNSNASFSDGAIYARPGLRYALTDAIELNAGVMVSSADKYDSKLIDFGGYFRVMQRFDVGLGVDLGDATRGFRGSLRMRW